MSLVKAFNFKLTFLLVLVLSIEQTKADNNSHDEAVLACMSNSLRTAEQETTVAQLRSQCNEEITDLITERSAFEEQVASNPFAILPHKPNYILPISYSEANEVPYGNILQGRHFDDTEAKFQISLKFVAVEDFLVEDLDMQMAFTATSWWQAYNSDISAPFRETNYQPEVIFNYSRPWSFLGVPISNSLISLNHQSNGQAGELSRSWNRVIAGATTVTGDVVWDLRAWWRIPEEEDQFLNDPSGDDNPNIEEFLGYGEIGMLWPINKNHNIDILMRNNLRSENKGAIQIGWSFPLTDHLRGYVEYFNGYGESLIYYDQSVERLGIGFKLTDWL